MACSTRQSANAFPAEVARFLEVRAEDVARLIEMDGLPASKIPKRTRCVVRIPLHDFHRWWVARSRNVTTLLNFDAFLDEFHRTARIAPAVAES